MLDYRKGEELGIIQIMYSIQSQALNHETFRCANVTDGSSNRLPAACGLNFEC